MTRVTLLAAVGRNGVIGRDGDLPWHLPEDLRHFKVTTMGHPIVMGRRTFESIGRVLPGRRTLVVTRSATWQHPDVETAHSFEEALALAGPADEVFVVGGGEVYAAALPFAHRLLLTEVDAEPDGDTFFPEWDRGRWREVAREPHDGFAVVTYER
jgi:dihydrofolate reductase